VSCVIEPDVHEDVERGVDLMRFDAEACQRDAEVLMAAGMVTLVSVEDFEHALAAGREGEVVAAHRVCDDAEHHAAVIRVQLVAGAQVKFRGVVERSA
jgi:hypothetical protein